jgi:undecaprenyl-diphosphatase
MIKRWWHTGIYWDTALFSAIFDLNGWRILDRFFYAVSRSADGYVYPAVCLLVLRSQTSIGLTFFSAALAGFVVEIAVYKVAKHLVKRSRPFRVLPDIHHLIAPPDPFSFPSGHTAGAVLFALLVAHFFPALGLPLFLWAGLVGLSRIYLGVHYPSDVCAGAILGLASGKIALAAVLSATWLI